MKTLSKMKTSEKAAAAAASIAVLGMTASQIHAQDTVPAAVQTAQTPVAETANTPQTEQAKLESNVAETATAQAQAQTEMQTAQAADQQAQQQAQQAQQALEDVENEIETSYGSADSGISTETAAEQNNIDQAQQTIEDAQMDIEKAGQENAALEEEKTDLQSEKGEAEQAVVQAQENTGGLTEEDLANAQADLETAQQDLADAQNDLADKQMVLENNKKDLEAAKTAQEDAQKKLDELTSQRETLSERLKEATDKKDQAQAIYDTMMAGEEGEALRMAEQDLAGAKAELEQAVEAQTAAQDALDKKMQELKAAEAALSEAQKALDKAIADRIVDSTYLQTLKGQIDALSSQKAGAQSEADSLDRQIASLQTQIQDAGAALDKIHASMQKIESDHAQAMIQYTALLNEVESAKADYEEWASGYEATRQRAAAVRSDLQEAKNMLAKSEVQNDPQLLLKYKTIKERAEKIIASGTYDEDNLNYLKRSMDSAKKKYDDAVKKLDNFYETDPKIKAYNNFQNTVAQKEAEIEALKTKLETAGYSRTRAEKEAARLGEMLSAYQQIQKEAMSGTSRLELNVIEAEAAVQSCQKTVDTLNSVRSELQKYIQDARQQAAKQEPDTVSSRKDMEAAKAQLDAIDQKIANAQKTVDGHQDPHSNKEYAKGSMGFFEWLKAKGYNVDAAIDLLKTSKEIAFTDMGKAGDSTDLDMFRKALQWIDYANHIRTDEEGGLQALKVSPYLMAMSESNIGYSTYTEGHSKQYSRSENLAYGYADYGRGPFVGWYDQEKVNHETQNGGQTGHYYNLIGKSDVVTGFACTGNWSRNVFVQVFGTEKEAKKGDNFTVQEMLDLLDQYIASIAPEEKAYKDAQEFLNTAQTGRAAAKAAYASALDVYNADSARSQALRDHVKTLEDAYSTFDKEYADAGDLLEQAQTALQSARAIFEDDHEVQDRTADRDAAAAARQKASDAKDVADAVVQAARAVVENKTGNVADKQQVLDTVKAGIQAAKDNLDRASDAMDQAQKAYDDAVQKVIDQTAVETAAQNRVNESENAVQAALQNVDDAKDNVAGKEAVVAAADSRVQDIRGKLADLLAARANLNRILDRIQAVSDMIEANVRRVADNEQKIAEAADAKETAQRRLEKCETARLYLASLTKDSVIPEDLTFQDGRLDALIPAMRRYVDALGRLDGARANAEKARKEAAITHQAYTAARARYEKAAKAAANARKALNAYIAALQRASAGQAGMFLGFDTGSSRNRAGASSETDDSRDEEQEAETDKKSEKNDPEAKTDIREDDLDGEAAFITGTDGIVGSVEDDGVNWGIYAAEIAAGLAVVGGVVIAVKKRRDNED